MEQNMTEQELELLKQIREDLDVVEHEYGCKIDREEMLTKVLERNLNKVRPEEAALFFSGVLPSGWRQTYLGKKKLSDYLNKLRDDISVQWCKEYLEPELSALLRSESIKALFKDSEIPANDYSLGRLKHILGGKCKKKELFASREKIDRYMQKLKVEANISPHFRFIRPERFAEIVDIYLEAMEERGDCTQEELGVLLGKKQGTVSKLRKEQRNITAEKENQVLRCLYLLHIKDNLRKDLGMQNIQSLCTGNFYMNLKWIKNNRLFAAFYLAVLLGFSVRYNGYLISGIPATIADLNDLLKIHPFGKHFDPYPEDTFCAAQPKETNRNMLSLRELIRLTDQKPLFSKTEARLDKFMQMKDEYFQLLHQMPEIFFTDLPPSAFVMNYLCQYLEEMRHLRGGGRYCLMSKMETVETGWNILSSHSHLSQTLFVYLQKFFQLMEYLSDNKSYNEHPGIVSCDRIVSSHRKQEKPKPLTITQKQEYRKEFENYIDKQHPYTYLLKLLQLKFSMTMQEWYFWLKMELLWYSEKNEDCWRLFMEKCIQEAREADRRSSKNDPDT